MSQYTNRLIHEKSPYLLQHAHNPVDWYPWGEEAFAKAREEDKPILLSIGYATCHWCHVMEKESFSNLEVAKLLNEVFVNIKVDREELPHIDNLYMEFAQALMSSSGGWPLNVVLTPDLKPIFAVTYMPPEEKRGMIGMKQFAMHIHKLWGGGERTLLIEQAEKLVEVLARSSEHAGHDMLSQRELQLSIEMLFELADPVYGGMKGAPKFPLGYHALFLMQEALANKDSRALFLLELTLTKMACGGIYDHLGGGFSRYAIDERWHVPHFEKMLYDNAILARAYLEAWRFTKNPRYIEVCRETLDYILRDMMHPQGGFYSAEDADSEGGEGRFYTWTPSEVQELLPHDAAELFCLYYGITYDGNFDGRSVLHVDEPIEEIAERQEMAVGPFKNELRSAREILFKKRETRPRPIKDDKIITAWNGLMIDALIKAGKALGEPRYIEAALKAADFIQENLWDEGRLFRRWREGEPKFPGVLDDYASLIKGALSLFEEGLGTKWLQWAIDLAEVLRSEFKAEQGAFYSTDRKENVLLRKCEFYDGAEPSGNGVHAENLIRLYNITGDESYLQQAEEIFKAAKSYIDAYPPGACYHLMAFQRYLDSQAPVLVIALNAENAGEKELNAALQEHFCPHAEVIWKREKDALLTHIIPAVADKVPLEGKTTLYLCRQNTCLEPSTDLQKSIELIKGV